MGWRTEKIRSKGWLLIVFALAAAAAGLSVLVSSTSPVSGEEAMLEWLRNAEVPLLDLICRSLDCLGGRWMIIGTVVALSAVLWVRRRRTEAIACLLIIPLEMTTLGIREVIGRERPVLTDLAAVSESAGFPSGTTLHAVMFFGFIVYLVHVYMRPGKLRFALQGLLILAIAVISYSRIYVGAHWPTDILGAWLYGGVFLWGIVAVGVSLISRVRVAVEKRTSRIYNGLKC